MIIFRGALQYCIDPRLYLRKAMRSLKEDGHLYITSPPNTQSICFKLFKENFVLPVGVTDYYRFNETLITDYIESFNDILLVKNIYLQKHHTQTWKRISLQWQKQYVVNNLDD